MTRRRATASGTEADGREPVRSIASSVIDSVPVGSARVAFVGELSVTCVVSVASGVMSSQALTLTSALVAPGKMTAGRLAIET